MVILNKDVQPDIKRIIHLQNEQNEQMDNCFF
jgi:hypothetical protein